MILTLIAVVLLLVLVVAIAVRIGQMIMDREEAAQLAAKRENLKDFRSEYAGADASNTPPHLPVMVGLSKTVEEEAPTPLPAPSPDPFLEPIGDLYNIFPPVYPVKKAKARKPKAKKKTSRVGKTPRRGPRGKR